MALKAKTKKTLGLLAIGGLGGWALGRLGKTTVIAVERNRGSREATAQLGAVVGGQPTAFESPYPDVQQQAFDQAAGGYVSPYSEGTVCTINSKGERICIQTIDIGSLD